VADLFGMGLKRRFAMLRRRMPRRSLRPIAEEHDLLRLTKRHRISALHSMSALRVL
jgi:hypothetical protein